MSEDETTAGVLFVRERTSPRQYRCSCFTENKERCMEGERERDELEFSRHSRRISHYSNYVREARLPIRTGIGKW